MTRPKGVGLVPGRPAGRPRPIRKPGLPKRRSVDPDFFTGRTGGREVETEARILGFALPPAKRLQRFLLLTLGGNIF
jgi:hypothetical protein